MTRHTIASVPTDEAATATRHACTTPSRRDNYPLQNSAPLDRWATAASRLSSTLRDRVASWLREVFGEVEFTLGDYCTICDDVHATGAQCPRAMLGPCLDCGNRWRALDRFGNCATCGSASIVKRRLRYRR